MDSYDSNMSNVRSVATDLGHGTLVGFHNNVEPLLEDAVKKTYIGVVLKNIQNKHVYNNQTLEKSFVETVDTVVGFGAEQNGAAGQAFMSAVQKDIHQKKEMGSSILSTTKRLFIDYALSFGPDKVYNNAIALAYCCNTPL